MAYVSRQTVDRLAFRKGAGVDGRRTVPEETPVAFSYDGTTHAVMMATPDDLDVFALGFSFTEGIIDGPDDIAALSIVPAGDGIDLQIRLASGAGRALTERRRHMAGPVGCGLCGIESIEQALRPAPPVPATQRRIAGADIARAVAALDGRQPLHEETRAVHAAGFFAFETGMRIVREDVGRHNAVDKLAGAMLVAGIDPGCGAVVVTSRVSVEIVQKTAALGCPFLFAVSAPTALALRTAEAAGITLAAIVRGEEFEVFTHTGRLAGDVADVA